MIARPTEYVRGLFASDDTPDPSAGVELDTLLDALANERRRLAVRVLADRHEPVTLGELASRIAAREYECDREAVSAQERKRVHVSLYQTHLAALEAAGVCTWDRGADKIAPTAATELAVAVLRDIDDRLGRDA